LTAFDTAWDLMKTKPRFVFHAGNAPIGEPLDPSKLPSNGIMTTRTHNEILQRPHGIFSTPIGSMNKYRLHEAINVPTYGKQNKFLIDMLPYDDVAYVGDYPVADSLGYHGEVLQDLLHDDQAYDEDEHETFQRLIDSIPSAYDPYIRDYSEWKGKRWEVPPSSGGYEYVEIGDMWHSNDVEIADRSPQNTFEVIIPTKVSPDDYMPLGRREGIDEMKEWMADRVRSSL